MNEDLKVKLTVSELAKIVGIAPRTIRFYAAKGVFEHSGTTENGYRYYTIEKIEELRLIVYLRYLDVPIKEIKAHLKNRSIDDYDKILENQLKHTQEKIKHLKFLESRLEKRLDSLRYIRTLPEMNTPVIKDYAKRRILRMDRPIEESLDWEKALLEFEHLEQLPPSLIIGDVGFFVDLNRVHQRHATEFTGLYLISDEPLLEGISLVDYLPEGQWLTYIVQGDHRKASQVYDDLLTYADDHGLLLDDYAIERVLLDHFISSNPEVNVTEIQIPILESKASV